MLKTIAYFCILSSVLFQSCRSGYTAIEENVEKTIKISTPTKELYNNIVIIKLIRVNDFEIHIPLVFISKYVEFKNEDILRHYVNYLNDILSSFKNGVFDGPFYIDNDEDMNNYRNLKSHDIKFYIKDSKFFESGDYFVYNTKTKEYVKEVKITIKSWYAGPLAASYDYIVTANNIVIYMFSAQS